MTANQFWRVIQSKPRNTARADFEVEIVIRRDLVRLKDSVLLSKTKDDEQHAHARQRAGTDHHDVTKRIAPRQVGTSLERPSTLLSYKRPCRSSIEQRLEQKLSSSDFATLRASAFQTRPRRHPAFT